MRDKNKESTQPIKSGCLIKPLNKAEVIVVLVKVAWRVLTLHRG